MSEDQESLFREEMTGVAPLRRESRVDRASTSGQRDGDASLDHRRQAAVQDQDKDRNSLTSTRVTPRDAYYVLDFKRPGVQNGVYRKLKQGRYEALARLDLHRMSVERARREIFEFIEESHALGLRSVMVIHGKGETSVERERSSILKGGVDHWLRELSTVQAFHSAQPQHGGTGAVYVLLKKSEEKKREARERYSKGRIPYEP